MALKKNSKAVITTTGEVVKLIESFEQHLPPGGPEKGWLVEDPHGFQKQVGAGYLVPAAEFEAPATPGD